MTVEVQVATHKAVSVNPATCADAAHVEDAVTRARAAQPAWQEAGVRQRLAIINEFQRLLNERKQQVACVITSEAGKPVAEALLTEVLVVLDTARFLLEETYGFLREQPLPHGNLATKAKTGRLIREPYGVIGIISPWNYPFSIPATETLAALATGNAVVLKPSELTPRCVLELATLLHDAGVPKDIFQVVIGEGSAGAALIESGIGKLIFTGSVATGLRVAQTAAARLLPVVLELGGKDPMMVLDDADVDVASSGAVWGAFVNAGQACLSVERCYVHRSIYDAFVSACVEKTKRLRVGNGADPNTDIGPLIRERQIQTVERHVADARSRGARVMTGGERLASLGPNYYSPTVLADATHEMLIMHEETFGPVLPIMPFDADAEAIRLANESDYGLAASVWTRDRDRGEKVARQINAGTVMVNDAISCFGITEAPHGGVKASGIGRTHGRYGLEEMVRMKYLDVDLLPRAKKPWWYGYGAGLGEAAGSLLDFQFGRGIGRRFVGGLRSLSLIHRPRL
jgi:succinate-semialdehyde dehydrogenase/glutarate-semialdehyde dehydrogenase